jgi:hypothetical protein
VKGEVGEYRERLIDFLIAQGIELEFKESIAPALGMSYGGRIAILPGQATAEEFSTLVHELAHLCCVGNYVVTGSQSEFLGTKAVDTTKHNLISGRRGVSCEDKNKRNIP